MLRVSAAAGKKAPRAAILGAQSVRCANHCGRLGYEAGKKVLGRKRHLVVDNPGFISGVLVTPGQRVSDPAGAAQLRPEVVRVALAGYATSWADRTCRGMKVVGQWQAWFPRRGLRVEIVRAREGVKGFAVQPHRWIIERTFAWLTTKRPLVRDYAERARGQQRSHDPPHHLQTHAQTPGKLPLLDSL